MGSGKNNPNERNAMNETATIEQPAPPLTRQQPDSLIKEVLTAYCHRGPDGVQDGHIQRFRIVARPGPRQRDGRERPWTVEKRRLLECPGTGSICDFDGERRHFPNRKAAMGYFDELTDEQIVFTPTRDWEGWNR